MTDRERKSSLLEIQNTFLKENLRVLKYDRTLVFLRSFSFMWGCLIFICDVYAICSAFFWLGAEGFPRGINMVFGMISEALLITDFCFRLYARGVKLKSFDFLQIYSKGWKASIFEGALNLISVIPYDFIFSRTIDYSENQANVASYFEAFKLLRIRSAKRFLTRTQDFLFYNDFRLLFRYALFKTFLNLLLSSHLAACLLMIVAKFQKISLDSPVNEHLNRTLAEIYLDSMLWAICSMKGDDLQTFRPSTAPEIIVIEFFMFFGAFSYAHIFGYFHKIIDYSRKEIAARKRKFENCKEFSVEKGLPVNIKRKVKYFYTMDPGLYNEVINLKRLSKLPLSLRTEILLFHNEDMIKNVKLFGLSSPFFILEISKHLQPKFAMEGDIVLRTGEIADKFFFIQRGKVEIRATDNISVIATLDVGCYFGEIGLLVTGKRTVFVHALKDCVFQTISKGKFEKIMNSFPEQRSFLLKVANQRMLTTNTDDLLETSVIPERKDVKRHSKKLDTFSMRAYNSSGANLLENEESGHDNMMKPVFSFSESELSWPAANGEAKGESLYSSKAFEDSIIQNALINLDLRNLIIYPTSWIFKIWFSIIMLTCFYNLFYVPFSIAFEIDVEHAFLFSDILCFSVFFADFIFQSRTSYKDKEEYIKKPDAILINYFNNYFLIDFLSFLPIDYVVFLCGSPGSFMRWIRFLRLLKLVKLWKMEEVIEGNSDKKTHFQNLLKKLVLFCYLNHFFACLMYAVSLSCFNRSEQHSMIGAFNENKLKDQVPLEQASLVIRYINFFYFSLGVSSSGSYGDIRPQAAEEKIIHILGLFFFPINFSFLAAEIMELANSSESTLKSHLSNVHNTDQWMKHLRLPQKLQKRVYRYHEHLWNEFKGVKDNDILNDLPDTLRNEILLFLFRNVVEKIKYFQINDPGIVLTLIKYLRIDIMTKGEWICRSGEIAREMFFIVEGQAAVYNEAEKKRMTILKKGDYYGEIAILSGKGSIRSTSVRALSNLTLASFALEDFNSLCEQYPAVYEKIKFLSEDKQEAKNQKQNLKLQINENSQEDDNYSPDNKKEQAGIIEKLWRSSFKRNDSFLLNTPDPGQQANGRFFKLKPELIGMSENSRFLEKTSAPPSKNKKNLSVMIPVLTGYGFGSSPISGRINKGRRNCKSPSNSRSPPKNNSSFDSNEEFPSEHNDVPLEENSGLSVISRIEKTDQNNQSTSEDGQETFIMQQEPYPKILECDVKEPLNSRPKDLQEALGDLVLRPDSCENCFIEDLIQVNPNDIAVLESAKYFETEFDEILNEIEGPLEKGSVAVKTSYVFKCKNVAKTLMQRCKSATRAIKTLKFWMSFIVLYCIVYTPFILAFEHSIQWAFFIVAEISCIFVFSADLFNQFRAFRQKISAAEGIEKKGMISKQFRKHWLSLLYKLILLVPFSLIFEALDWGERHCRIHLILLQTFRITNIQGLLQCFKLFKRKDYAAIKIIQIILLNILFAHVLACFYILIANCEGDNENSWIRQIPSASSKKGPQHPGFPEKPEQINPDDAKGELTNQTIYIHALYWTYSTIAHIGFNDVLALTVVEKVYCSIVIIITTFITVYMFGNIASLAEQIAPTLKSNFNKEYKAVMKFLKYSNMECFQGRLEKYFDYIWRSNKGIDENQILKNLPSSIRCDIQMHRYIQALQAGRFFKVEAGRSFNVKIAHSILKYMKYKIFLPTDFVFFAGDLVEDIYILLEGRLEAVGFNLAFIQFFEIGDQFGCIEEGESQPYSVRATSISKVGVLKRADFKVLGEAYPRWIKKLTAETNQHRARALLELDFFDGKKVKDINLIRVSADLQKYYEQQLQDLHTQTPFEQLLRTEHDETPPFLFTEKNAAETESPLVRQDFFELKRQISHKFREAESSNKKIINSFRELLRQPFWRKDFSIHPNSNLIYKALLLKLILISYNVFALPLIVCFQVEVAHVVIIIETIYSLLSLINILVKLKTAQYINGTLVFDLRVLFMKYLKSELLIDVLFLIPFVIIIPDEKSIISSFTRLLRVLQVFFLKETLTKIEGFMRSKEKLLTFFKAVFLLGIVWHLTTCFWMWVNLYLEPREGDSFYEINNLIERSLGFRYMVASFFVINIVTSVGSDVALAQNDFEKCVLFFILYIGTGFFALSFGLIAANIHIFPEKFNELFDSMKKIISIFEKQHIPPLLKSRTEDYFSYAIDLRQNDMMKVLKSIKHKIPKRTDYLFAKFEEILFAQTESFLLKLPFLRNSKNIFLLQGIAKILESAVFLPNDYIIFKDGIGDEMYFIREGEVKVLSSNESQVIATLSKGSYFGEIALFLANSQRICSVVAGDNFVYVFILKQKHLKTILKKFPSIEEEFRKEGQRRLEEFRAHLSASNPDKEQKQENEMRESDQDYIDEEDEEEKQENIEKNSKIDIKKDYDLEKCYREEEEEKMNMKENESQKEQMVITSTSNDERKDDIDMEKLVNIETSERFKWGSRSAKSNEESASDLSNEWMRVNKTRGTFSKLGKKFKSMTSIGPARTNLDKNNTKGDSRIKRKINSELNFKKSKKKALDNSLIVLLSSSFHSRNEVVEDDELFNNNIKKQSRRRKTKNKKERRFSRINLEKEVTLSSTTGLRLHWALH